jgi:hypothetical protein
LVKTGFFFQIPVSTPEKDNEVSNSREDASDVVKEGTFKEFLTIN